MVPEASSESNRRGHLRLVGEVAGSGAEPERKHIETDGMPVLSPAEARAEAIRRESHIFRTARQATVASPVAESAPAVPPVQSGPAVDADRPAEPMALEELGSRYEAFAPQPAAGASEATDRIENALASLRAESVVPFHPELWPVNHLADLAKLDKASAGRWIIALVTQLHRVQPNGLLDLRMASGQTIRAVALGDETRIDWAAAPSRRVPFVKATEARLAELSLGLRRPRRRQREAVAVLRALAAAPISLSDLGRASGSVIDPFAFWQMVRVARPAAPEGIPALLTHVDPQRRVYDVTVEFNPGRPLKVRLGVDPDADAAVHTAGGELLRWATHSERPASGSPFLITGDADAELAALRAIGRSNSPIRQYS